MAPDVVEAIDEQLEEIRALADQQESDPHLTGILLACFGRLKKTAQDHGLDDLAEVAAASAADCRGGHKARALGRLLDDLDGESPRRGALPPIVVLAVPALGVRIREEAEWCSERVEVVSDTDALGRAVARLQPGRVLLPSDALEEASSFPEDARRSTWLYQPGADIDTEARGDALRKGAAGFVPWPLQLASALARMRAPVEGDSDLPYRALLLDGGRSAKVAEALEGGVDVLVEKDYERVLSTLEREGSEILVIDLDKHGGRALNLANAIRTHERLHPVEVVGVSTKGAMAAHATAAGIRHFVRVPITDAGLRGRLLAALREVRSTYQNAERDPRTGVYNRAAFLDRADESIARCRRSEEPLVACVVDVVGTTELNANHGLGSGDRVLRLAAEVLIEDLRRTDLVGRIGGDAFGVVLPGCTMQKAWTLLRDAQESFTAWFRPGSPLAGTEFTVGVVDASEGTSGLLHRAEQAMFAAEPGSIKVG